MTILRSAMYVKVDDVDVLKYVQSYDLTQGRGQPFPILRLILAPANKVDALTTVAEGNTVEVYASGEGTFLITDIDKTDNEYHITAVHESVQLKAMNYPVWLEFDGVDDYVSVPSDTSINITGDMTVSFWMKGDGDRAMSKREGGTDDGWVFYLQDGSMTWWYNGNVCRDDTQVIDADSWDLYVGVYDATASELTLYFNGVPIQTTSSVTALTHNDGTLLIGEDNGHHLTGAMRDVRIYNTALSASDVTALYNGTDMTTGLVGRWRMNEGVGDVVKDTASGNNGTIEGATWNTFGQPEELFTTLMEYIGYDTADISAPATSYGDITIPEGENAWEVIKYLADLTGRRAFFTSSQAYFIGTGTTKTIALGGSSPSVNVLGRPIITRNNEDVINSMRVLYEMGEVTDSDATSIATHGERREERRSLTTEATTSTNTVREDAVNLASQLIIDNKDPITGISYQVNERKRDGSDNKVWEPTYDITDLGTITDNYTSTSVTAVPLERVTHHLPLYGSTYEWGRISKGIGQDMSQLSSEVADRVHNGTLGNDLSSRPVAIQVYGDQDLEGFDPDTLTGFYLGKKKDALGNDVYIWAGVNDGTEQVRMDTDGRLKAGEGKVSLESNGLSFDVTSSSSYDGRTALRFVDDASSRTDKVRGHVTYWGGSSGTLYFTSYSNAKITAPQVIISGSSSSSPTLVRNTSGDVYINSAQGKKIVNRIEFDGTGTQDSSWRVEDWAMLPSSPWEDLTAYIEFKAGVFDASSAKSVRLKNYSSATALNALTSSAGDVVTYIRSGVHYIAWADGSGGWRYPSDTNPI